MTMPEVRPIRTAHLLIKDAEKLEKLADLMTAEAEMRRQAAKALRRLADERAETKP